MAKPKKCETCGLVKDSRKEFSNAHLSKSCIECMNAKQTREHEEAKAQRRKEKALAREAQQLAEARKREKDREAAKQRGIEKRDATNAAKREAREKDAYRRELQERQLCQRKLLPFIMRFHSQYIPGWVHKDICERLEKFSDDVIAGKSPRLMLFMPPRHGKSEIASINFPAWHLGRAPTHDFIASSYASGLTMGFSRKIRGMLRDPRYTAVFPGTKLDPENQSVETWMTLKGGTYVAAGVGGGITGKGANVLLIDDPVKNAEDADSATAQGVNWDWYTSTAYTRLAPGGGILVIQTRWNENDLSGRIIEQMEELAELGEKHDEWEIVEYPAIALEDERFRKQGEALHPARYDETALTRIRHSVGERVWWALYQQKPTAQDGSYFTRNMFKFYDGPAPGRGALHVYQAWDFAIGQKEENDFTVGVTVGVDENDEMWVLDVVKGKWDAMEIVENVLDQYVQWRPHLVGMEEGHIRMAIGPFLEKRMRERRLTSMAIEKLPPGRRDKAARARPLQGRMQQGMVKWPRHAIWMDMVQSEFLGFMAGAKHDDIVDAFAWIGLMINEIVPAKGRKTTRLESWKDKLRLLGSNASRDPMAS